MVKYKLEKVLAAHGQPDLYGYTVKCRGEKSACVVCLGGAGSMAYARYCETCHALVHPKCMKKRVRPEYLERCVACGAVD